MKALNSNLDVPLRSGGGALGSSLNHSSYVVANERWVAH